MTYPPDSEHNEILAPDALSGALLNYQWRRILVPMLTSALERIAPDDADFQNRAWALIEDIYTIESPAMPLFREARRTTNQSLVANTDTAVVWNAGDYDIGNDNRMPVPVNCIAVVTYNFAATYGTATVMNCWVRVNGSGQVAVNRSWSTNLSQWFNGVVALSLSAGDYIQLFVNPNAQNATINTALVTPRLQMAIIPLE